MVLIPPFIFACCVNIDAFLVGISYGLQKARITFCQNILISLIAFAGTLLSILSGSAIQILLPPFFTNRLGCLVLFFLGLFYLAKFFLCRLYPSFSNAETKITLPLSLRSTFILALSLSCNNIGIGIGASLDGIPLLPTSVITLFTSILFLSAGNRLGRSSLLSLSPGDEDLLSGIMLLLLGLFHFL